MARKGTYSITNIMHLIARDKGTSVVKSVPTPSAQTFDSCAGHARLEEINTRISSALEYWKIHYPIIYHFALIQLYSGARVSEILRLHSNEITADCRIMITSLKGGNNRIVQLPVDQDWIRSERSKNRFLFRDLSRFVIHREYVKQGISAYFGNNTKRSTTHIFRHLVALDLKQISDETQAIKIGLGQKTDQATDHYKTEIRKKNNSI